MVERRPLLETYSRSFRQMDISIFDYGIISESAEWLKIMRIRFASAKAERCRNVQRKKMSAVRYAALPGPAIAFQRFNDFQIFRKSVAVGGVEQWNIAVAPQAAISQQVFRFGQREERLAGAERRCEFEGDIFMGLEIERIAHILKPSESILRQSLCRADR